MQKDRINDKDAPPDSVDAYLAALPRDQRVALERLRKVITAAAPDAVECISYRIPAYKLDGRMLVGFAAASGHCTFHLMSTTVMTTMADALKGHPVGKGSVQFPPDRMLPTALVAKLVKARIAEVRGSAAGSRASGSRKAARSTSVRKRK